jgi:hypothetical protein
MYIQITVQKQKLQKPDLSNQAPLLIQGSHNNNPALICEQYGTVQVHQIKHALRTLSKGYTTKSSPHYPAISQRSRQETAPTYDAALTTSGLAGASIPLISGFA